MDALPAYDQCLINAVFEIEDLKARLTFIRAKRMELQDLLFQSDLPYSDEQIQILQADEIALSMLERAYLDNLSQDGLFEFEESNS